MRRLVVAGAGIAISALIAAGCSSSSSSGSSPSSSVASRTQSFGPQVTQQLQNVVSVAQQQFRLPGVVAAVDVPGEGTWQTASGQATLSPSQPVTVNTPFWIGSITKTFTGTVILQLVQQGKLSLTTPISQWEPSVQNAGSITVQMLLDMTSGIFDEGGPGSQVSANPSATYTPQQIVDLAVAHGPAGPPGQFYYSDTNYVLLGIIAQDVTGQPIQSLVSSQVVVPLHLAHTSFPTTTPTGSSAPVGNGYLVGQGQPVPGPAVNPTALGAAGAMISTLGDLQVWARALATGTMLSPAIQQQRLQYVPTGITFPPLPGTAVSTGLPVQYGLGISSWGGLLGHNGQANAYTSDVLYLPARNATIVVLTNGYNPNFAATQGGNVSDAAAVSLAQIALPGALTTAPPPTSPARPVH